MIVTWFFVVCTFFVAGIWLLSRWVVSRRQKQQFIAETVDSYERYYNRGFISYRKSVTEAGQFAALEWSGRGSSRA